MALDWGKVGTGMLSTGMDLWGAQAQKRADEKRLAAARGPVYGAAQTGALGEMAAAGGITPEATYNQQQAMLAPQQAKQQSDLYRQLYSKGMLGVANYSGGTAGAQGLPAGGPGMQVPGAPGAQPMNPYMAALAAGQSNANANLAANAQTQASNLRTAAIGRAGTLQGIGGAQQTSGLQPYRRGSGVAAAGKSMMPGMISGIGGLLKDSGAMKGIGEWFAGLNKPDYSGYDFNKFTYTGFDPLRNQGGTDWSTAFGD